MRIKLICLILGCLPTLLYAGEALFTIQLALNEQTFPTSVGWYDPPITRFMSISNQSGASMPVTYTLPHAFSIDSTRSTCGSTLAAGDQCQLAVVFNPDTLGSFEGKLQVCGNNELWCSVDPVGFHVTVTNTDLVSKQCSTIQSRPFAALDCAGSYTYAQNFYNFMTKILHTSLPTTQQHFQYFQHTPSANETTVPCLEAKQTGVNLDPSIQGGGAPLCALMGYATSNNADNANLSKLFPPYLTFLLATEYPIMPNTVALDRLPELLATFSEPVMDSSVQNLGYHGYVDFLNSYYIQQASTPYPDCGTSAVCPSLYYLPYPTSEASLLTWPPTDRSYWGISGGGGSGAGYQIEAFKPGSATHYILFSGGGGGGGGETTPENLKTAHITLINTGSGGGGGSQFANCYVTPEGNLTGLGLGAGTGAGLSAIEGLTISYQQPPATDYSFYPPLSHPTWDNNTTLNAYGLNLSYLFNHLIPELYNQGYSISISGGGGGGSGLEFLNQEGEAYQPQPLSIGYGFNFCYVFNKAQQYTAQDCISSSDAGSARAIALDNLIYKNMGTFFAQGMNVAVQACPGGYSNYACTCATQHAYVICQLTELLVANKFTADDIPDWLAIPHCNDQDASLISYANLMDQFMLHSAPNQCATAIQNFYQVKRNTSCAPPWPHAT